MQRKVGENDSLAIRSQLDLAGKTLNVVKGSPSILRIRNLSNEIGDTIYVNEIEKYGSEQLIAMVAHGDIDYAVCDEGIARMAVYNSCTTSCKLVHDQLLNSYCTSCTTGNCYL